MNSKGKLLLANRYIMSRIIYLIPLWGGKDFKYRRKVQAVMNETVRWISRFGKRTKKLKLMKFCKLFQEKEV